MSRKIENEVVRPAIIRDIETGTEYTLEFNRDSVRFAESRGFDLSDLSKFPMTKVYELFFYAFRMHHKNISREKTDNIIDEEWGGIGGLPDGLLERLALLFTQPFNSMKTEDERKNSKLTVEL